MIEEMLSYLWFLVVGLVVAIVVLGVYAAWRERKDR